MGSKIADLVAQLRKHVANALAVPVEIFTTYQAVKDTLPVEYQRGPLSGRELDDYAEGWFGINRQPGETDEQLHRRCIDTLNKAYEGALVVPHDDLREYLEAAINKEKQGVIRNE